MVSRRGKQHNMSIAAEIRALRGGGGGGRGKRGDVEKWGAGSELKSYYANSPTKELSAFLVQDGSDYIECWSNNMIISSEKKLKSTIQNRERVPRF